MAQYHHGNSVDQFIYACLFADEKDAYISGSNGVVQFVKCSVPNRQQSNSRSVHTNVGRQNCTLPPAQNCSLPPAQNCSQLAKRNSRPQSTDLTERIPNNKLPMERSLSNLVEGEKPKFSIRKPYIDRENRDKKSESWVPSYV